MTSDWQEFSIGDIGEVKTGKTPPSRIKAAYDGTVPFITPRDMDGRKWIDTTERYLSADGLAAVNTSLIPSRSVAVSCIGSDMGKAVMVAKPSVTNQQINTIIVDETKFNAEFVYYNLSQRQAELKSIASGSATPILNKGHFSNVKVLLPEKARQDTVVDILRSMDEKIELSRQINQTLKQIAQAIFKSWFVDFEPVTAKIQAKEEGRDPARAAMCAISGKSEEALDQLPQEQWQQLSETAALYPEELEESVLGLIPKGWKPVKYEQLYFERKHKVNNNNASVLSAVQTGELKLPDEVFDKQVHSENIAKYKLVYPGDLAFNPSRINIGSAGFNDFEFVGAVSPVYTVMGLTHNEYSAFARMHLKLDSTKEWINILCSGSVRQSLSVKDFLSIPVVLPSKEVNSVFVKIFRDTNKKIVANNKEIKTLTSIRDTLLPKLLSGELEITNDKAAFS